jgi:alkanesulfonate monooxygenase SsuD/methylene tetrahydromethanopterin reductase-like flavin-dependent oxidoreductase (luciferase family)
MRVGMQLVIQNLENPKGDEAQFMHEIRMSELAEEVGFDIVWCVEHHFDGYSMCPDNTQLLSYLAGRTKRILLGTGAVILPWWRDPVRVAEKLVMLDHMSDGRLVFGMGRGLSRIEYGGFGIDMNEARERFDEAIEIILQGLRTGKVEHKGKFFDQPYAEIRPSPSRSFENRLYCVAMSPDSVEAAARIGAGMMTFIQFPIERHMPNIEKHRALFRAFNNRPAPPAVLTDITFCDADQAHAEEMARKYMPLNFLAILRHYELTSTHFGKTKGYAAYDEIASMLRDAGHEAAASAYVDTQVYGTPDRILRLYEERLKVTGPIEVNFQFSYGNMPFDACEKSIRLFAKEVLPNLKQMLAAAARPLAQSAE